MKKGKWNYSEDIMYVVIIGKLLPVADPKLHWQNAFAGEERQMVKVEYKSKGQMKQFYIDNGDGSGLKKIAEGGGPGSYSAHVADFEFIKELPESEWQQWDKEKHHADRLKCDQWQKDHFPEEWEKMQSMMRAWEKSHLNPKNL